jgi:proteasome accessory factor A
MEHEPQPPVPAGSPHPPRRLVPKVCGADVELGNFIVGANPLQGTGYAASRLLLREVQGIQHSSWSRNTWNGGNHYAGQSQARGGNGYSVATAGYAVSTAYDYESQDWGRKFLPTNGGCVYVDLNHLELCIPECGSAYDFVAAWHAMLLLAREAAERVNARLDHGRRLQVLVNNSDGQGNSYGAHMNFLLARRTWDDIFHRKPHYLAFLAAYQVSSIVIGGQGKVGAENGVPDVDFQLSQRADFFETLTALQTTYSRPLINTRDEPLCVKGVYDSRERRGPSPWARLHVIFHDANLCHAANFLKCGMMQIVLAMLEAGTANPALILEDPLAAVLEYSRDPTLQARARTASGQQLTAVELQLRFVEEAEKLAAAGVFAGIVPAARDILDLATDTLQKLRSGDLDAVAGRLDWVLKRQLLERAMAQRPGLDWTSPQIKHLDFAYSNLDPNEGLYWSLEQAGVVQRLVSPARVEYFRHEPPADTRAYTRAMLLRLAGPQRVDRVDWDSVCVKLPGRFSWPSYRTLDLPHPLALTKAETGDLFASGGSLEEVFAALSGLGKDGQGHPSDPPLPPGEGRGEGESGNGYLSDPPLPPGDDRAEGESAQSRPSSTPAAPAAEPAAGAQAPLLLPGPKPPPSQA